MSETPFFFPCGDTRLFGMLYRPEGPAPRSGFVLSHPFFEEKLWSHRVLVSLARALSARGHVVLRFDYAGAGDSTGSTLDSTIGSHLAELEAAIRVLTEREPSLERIGLVGLRLGATFAALAMERAAEGALPAALRNGPLVLWEPVTDGTAYLQDVMRSNLSVQLHAFGKVVETREAMQQRVLEGGSINVDGYEIGRPLFVSANRTDLIPLSPKAHQGPTLVTAIIPPGKPKKPRKELEALAAAFPAGKFTFADEQPFWREIKQFYGRAPQLEAATLDWLERTHG